MITTIPAACMAYTEVYKTVRIEMGLAMAVGILLGALIVWVNKD